MHNFILGDGFISSPIIASHFTLKTINTQSKPKECNSVALLCFISSRIVFHCTSRNVFRILVEGNLAEWCREMTITTEPPSKKQVRAAVDAQAEAFHANDGELS